MIPLFLCLIAAGSNHGLEGRRVVVVGAAGSPEAAELVTAALQARGLVPVAVAARAGIDGVVVDLARGDREQVRALLQSARLRFRELDLEAAELGGRQALDEGLRLERPEDQRELLVDVLLFLAAVRLSIAHDDDDGARFLRLASRLEPERLELNPGLHAPSAVAAWTGAREKNADAENAVVVVAPRVLGAAIQAAGVEIIVDGTARAAGGGLLVLPAGPHLITLRARGCESSSRIVDVKGTTTPPLNDTLAPPGVAARRKLAAQALQAGDVAAFAVVAGLVDADVVVALAAGGAARGWRGPERGVVDVDADPADPAAFAAAVVEALGDRPLPPNTQAPVVDDDPAPLWVVGVSLGSLLVVATAAVLTVFLLPGEVPDPPPRPVPVTCCAN